MISIVQNIPDWHALFLQTKFYVSLHASSLSYLAQVLPCFVHIPKNDIRKMYISFSKRNFTSTRNNIENLTNIHKKKKTRKLDKLKKQEQVTRHKKLHSLSNNK